MKELSIEQKAKRYDEIIKKANKLHNENCEVCKICIEELIPELAESEDEKIRKEIVDFLELPHPQFVGKRDHEKWIAWLEKQGEHETDRKNWSEEDDRKLRDCIHAIKNTYYVGYDELIHWLRDITNN